MKSTKNIIVSVVISLCKSS